MRRILRKYGIKPPSDRKQGLSWSEFIQRHQSVTWASDFLTTEVWSQAGLVSYHILFFINLARRKVHIAGATPPPTEEWMKQAARDITGWDGELEDAKYRMDLGADEFWGRTRNETSSPTKSI
ncbi:MAG: putative transposase [Rhodothermales bacterium]